MWGRGERAEGQGAGNIGGVQTGPKREHPTVWGGGGTGAAAAEVVPVAPRQWWHRCHYVAPASLLH